MKLDKQDYLKHHAPISLILGYIVGAIACIVGLEFLRRLLMGIDFELWIFNDILRIVLFLVAYAIVGLSVCWIFTFLFGYHTKKIYRGIGFYRFMNIMASISPLSIVMVVILGIAGILTINFHSFYNMVALVVEILFPCFLRVACYNKYFIRKCPSCGLINTMKHHSDREEQTGTRFEVYNEGVLHYKPVGYTYSERKKTTTMQCSICGGYDFDYSTYDKQV